MDQSIWMDENVVFLLHITVHESDMQWELELTDIKQLTHARSPNTDKDAYTN